MGTCQGFLPAVHVLSHEPMPKCWMDKAQMQKWVLFQLAKLMDRLSNNFQNFSIRILGGPEALISTCLLEKTNLLGKGWF